MRLARVLRGIVKTALTWAAVWAPLSLIPVGLVTLLGAPLTPRILAIIMISHAVTGAINGAVFGSVLAIAGRRKTFETLSLPWIAACGALGGALFPFAVRALVFATIGLPATALVSTLVTDALLGAGCATVTLLIARRAPALPLDTNTAPPALGEGAASDAVGQTLGRRADAAPTGI